MKQSLKRNYFFVLFSLVSLLLYSCAEEKEFVKNDRNQNFDFKEKSFKEALALPVFNNAYQKVSKWKDAKKNKSASKTALEDEFGFTIVEDAPVRIITDENGTIFYTILIERELKEELKFENLLIKVQNDTTTAAIFKYTLTEKGIATEDNHYPIKDISDVEYTDLNLEGKYFYNSNGDLCNEINVIRCSVADYRPAGHIATQDCWDHFNNTSPGGGNYSSIYSSTQITCVNANIGGGNTTPTGSGNGGTSSNNTGGLGASGGNSNPPPPITAPIPCKTGNCIEDSMPLITPCDLINKLKNDTGFKTKMGFLKTRVDSGQNVETVFVLEQKPVENLSDNYTYQPTYGTANNPSPNYNYFTTSDAMIHCHYDGLSSFFTSQDLSDQYDKLKNQSISNDFFIGVVTKKGNDYGIYIIIIHDRAKFIAFGDNYLNQTTFSNKKNYEDFIRDKWIGKYKIDEYNSVHGNALGFVKLLKDYDTGVTIYSGNTLFNDWKKISYNSSTLDIKEENCN